MKKLALFLFLFAALGATRAHDLRYQNLPLKQWHLKGKAQPVSGSFYLLKEGTLYLEDPEGAIITLPISALSSEDRRYAVQKNQRILELNQTLPSSIKVSSASSRLHVDTRFLVLFFMLLVLAWFSVLAANKKRLKYIIPVWAVGVGAGLLSFGSKSISFSPSAASPAAIDSAFIPFKPNVHTFWDTNYFYVESKGIPTTHTMMVGISNHGWQQQVPIPQCYIGSNSWPIPLHPVMAANPIPVDNIHFTRGAIAIAANGVAIFNVHTNTGVDSYLDGQLDAFGGHCGRADDYHYHIAPLHLYAYTSISKPIAYGLDGFPVFGSVEPDGAPMQALDVNHGHPYNGGYHYHGTASAPYMIAQMAGQVTEDNTHQLIPQAAAHPVRPALTPLNGALITSCMPNASNNGYILGYTRNGNQNSIDYSWNQTGQYVFKFYGNGNLDSTKNYNGASPCSVPDGFSRYGMASFGIEVFPNPSSGHFRLQFRDPALVQRVKSIALYNLQGKILVESRFPLQDIDAEQLPNGIYLLRIRLEDGDQIRKVILQ